MSTKIFTFLLLVQAITAQNLNISFGIAGNFLISQSDKSGENTPWESETEKPSLSKFYNNNSGFLIDLQFVNETESFAFDTFIFGVTYENGSKEIKSSYLNNSSLGNTIDQQRYTPYIGFGSYLSNKTTAFGIFGVTIGSYTSTQAVPITFSDNTSGLGTLKYDYSSSTSIRVGGGLIVEDIKGTPLFICLKAYLEFGSFQRKNAVATYKGQIIEEFPNSDTVGSNSKIHDNLFALTFSLGYQFSFYDDEEKNE